VITLFSSNPSVPLPDPLWYEYLQEVFPDQPDEKLDIVQLTKDAERLGLTLIDLILYNHGKSLNATLPGSRHSVEEGMVLLLSASDLSRLVDVDVDVQCHEEGHPREWVSRYRNRLWVTRFWFGSIWLHHLGVEHLVVDIPLLINPAWLSPTARMMPLSVDGPLHESYSKVVETIPDLVKYLKREWRL
jgi:hypothetical protein